MRCRSGGRSSSARDVDDAEWLCAWLCREWDHEPKSPLRGCCEGGVADSGWVFQHSNLAIGEWAISLARSGFGFGPQVGIQYFLE